MSPFDPAGLKQRLKELDTAAQKEDLWEDPQQAQKLLKEKKSIENKIGEYEGLAAKLDEIEIILELGAEASEEEVNELEKEALSLYEKFQVDAEALRLKTLMNGEHDANDAIVSVHAGTGGVDAQDWAEMLLRMYTRWAEQHGYSAKVVDIQRDTEGGIKNATLIVEGENAYGYLKNERGVHRLVRISPFNTQGKRQTSFAKIEVMPQITDDTDIEIAPEDIRVDTYRASGAGGQHVNKTDSAIRITHLPTNIVVTCQNERSQHQNREVAMMLLKSRLTELAEQQKQANLNELKGDYSENTWGSQIRSYVFQPYTMVKDHRTGAEVGNVNAVMDGDIDYFINEKLKQKD